MFAPMFAVTMGNRMGRKEEEEEEEEEPPTIAGEVAVVGLPRAPEMAAE